MRRRFVPANEDPWTLWGLFFLFLSLLIYLFFSWSCVGFRFLHLILMILDAIPLGFLIRNLIRMRKYRRQRLACFSRTEPISGTGVAMERKCLVEFEYFPLFNHARSHMLLERNGGLFRSIRYYLHVELSNPVTGCPMTVKTLGYRLPLYRFLKSNTIQIYRDPLYGRVYLSPFSTSLSQREVEQYIPFSDAGTGLWRNNLPIFFSNLWMILFPLVLTIVLSQQFLH